MPAGAEEPGNPCRTCDPARSTTDYSVAVGRACGAGPDACSAQDTCGPGGECLANDLPGGTPCGDGTTSACDQADACDGSGICQPRPAPGGSPCDDGQFCTINDSCQLGVCVGGSQRDCGPNQICGANSCQCQGCLISGACLANGTRSPVDPCQVCDTSRNVAAFSAANTGGCDDGQFCTVDDSCVGGVCVGGGPRTCPGTQACMGNSCVEVAQPFDCTDMVPAQAPFPSFDTIEGALPPATGGAIPDGTYVTVQVTGYGSFAELDQFVNLIPATTIELRGGFFNESQVTYGLFTEDVDSGPLHNTGNYSTAGTSLTFAGVPCGRGGTTSQSAVGYSVVGDRLEIQRAGTGVRLVETLTRQ